MGNIKAIIFDFGFTLCTMPGVSMEKYMKIYQKGIDQCYSCLIEEDNGCSEESNQTLETTIMKIRRDAWRKSGKDNIEITTDSIMERALNEIYCKDFPEELINRLSDLFHSEEMKHWVPFEDTIHTLEALRAKDIKLGVLSNHPHHKFIQNILKKHNLTKFFHSISSSAEIGMRKPSRKVFEYVLNKLECGNTPEQTVYVGDEPWSDVQGGSNAGMKTVLIKREIPFPVERKILMEPDGNIDFISDLLNIIEEWN